MCAVFSGLPKNPEAGNSWLTLITLRYRIPLVLASSELSVEWRPKRTTSTGRTERKPRSKEDPREAKARDRARIQVTLPLPFTSPRPGTSARPASLPSPTRPAPQSQSLFRSYGSNLLTSFTYISLSTRGSLPWRPAADMGSTDSCATAVHTKPFSASVLQGLAGVFATTIKNCTDGGSRQAHAQTLLRTPLRPSYSSELHSGSARAFKQARDLTHLEFENRLRSFWPQGL
ncbi:hypothetical protein M0802_014212 [Mischocyttarus mexicanus]|nr:hypothetical protein M0802_014212 [Mischocyttarus mexicanus]